MKKALIRLLNYIGDVWQYHKFMEDQRTIKEGDMFIVPDLSQNSVLNDGSIYIVAKIDEAHDGSPHRIWFNNGKHYDNISPTNIRKIITTKIR